MGIDNNIKKLTIANPLNNAVFVELIKQLSLAAIYLILGMIIHRYFTSNGIVSAIWPGSGFALAAMLIGGRRCIFGILLGSLMLNTLIFDIPWTIVGMTLAQVSEAFFGAWLLTRNAKSVFSLNMLSSYLRLIVFGAGIACIPAAIIGPLSLLYADIINPTDYFDNVIHWWKGDVLGVVLLTPLILTYQKKIVVQIKLKQSFEAIFLLTLTFIAGQVVFLGLFQNYLGNEPRAYIMFLFVAWVAIRLGVHGASFIVLMIATQALWGAYIKVGFFANEIVVANLTNYWLYMMILSVVGMILAIYVCTIKQASKTINLSKQRFSDLVNSIDGIVWEADVATFDFTFVSEQAERLLGYPVEEWKKPGFWIEHMHPSDRKWAPEFCMSSTKRMETHDFEYRFIAQNGRTVWLRDIVNIVVENGTPQWLRGIMVDITDQKEAEKDLRIAATAFEAKEGMMITDADNVILRVNSAFTKITGYTAEEVYGKTPKMLSSGLHDKNFYSTMWDTINKTGSWGGEVKSRRKNGEIYPQYFTITSVTDKNGTPTNYVATLADISTTKAAEEEIKKLAFYDPLTGLPNRRLLLDRLRQALASSARSKHDGALLFIDIDNFKNINDTLGHNAGDELLGQVSERLKTCVREGDTVSRHGGDEFIVMLEELSKNALESATLVESVTNKILAKLNLPYQLGAHEYHGSVSIGVTIFCAHQQTMEELLKQADIAMYQAKKSGRNTVRFFDPKMQEVIVARSSLETELRKALDKQEFQLHYQIQVDNMNRPLGVEALIRWQHHERGMVSPAQFIPLAEETGLIIPIGNWVIETACAQIKAWQQDALTSNLIMSVNVSAKQFSQANFVTHLESTIHHFTIKPELLKLELTESMLVENIEETIATMDRLKDIGVKFSLDDFGTGYSSLQYLKRLPLDQLKIDQSFVRDITFDKNDGSIVRTIIAMAKSMNLGVIAEGVETKEQQELLLSNGCSVYQGYLFSKPLPIEQLETLLKKI